MQALRVPKARNAAAGEAIAPMAGAPCLQRNKRRLIHEDGCDVGVACGRLGVRLRGVGQAGRSPAWYSATETMRCVPMSQRMHFAAAGTCVRRMRVTPLNSPAYSSWHPARQ